MDTSGTFEPIISYARYVLRINSNIILKSERKNSYPKAFDLVQLDLDTATRIFINAFENQ